MASDSNGPIPSDYLTTIQGITNWILKKPSRFNIFGKKSTFQAKVLTDPVPLDTATAASVTQHVCMVRIIDPRMAHENYLDDPCVLATSDAAAFSQLANLHTRMMIPPQHGNTVMPQVDDIVDIVLDPARHGGCPYNLQSGQSLKVIDRPSAAAAAAASTECVPLASLYGGSAPIGYLGVTTPAPTGANAAQLTLDDSVCTDPNPGFYLVHPYQTDHYPMGKRAFSPRAFHPIDKVWTSHHGQDISGPAGLPVYAMHDGKITYKGYQSGAGNMVKIESPEGHVTKYFHLFQLPPDSLIKTGQTVSAGDQIGEVGSTGKSTGPHLHFELWDGSSPVDPIPYIKVIQKCSATPTVATTGTGTAPSGT